MGPPITQRVKSYDHEFFAGQDFKLWNILKDDFKDLCFYILYSYSISFSPANEVK